MSFISVMHNYSSLQCHMILQKSAQEIFGIIINAENSCANEYFCENGNTFIQDYLINIKFKHIYLR